MRLKPLLLVVVVAAAAGTGGYFLGARNGNAPRTANGDTATNPPTISPTGSEVGLDGVPRDGVAFATVKLSRAWDHEAIRPLRDWSGTAVPTKMTTDTLGFPLPELDRITAFWTTAAGRSDVLPSRAGEQFEDSVPRLRPQYALSTTRAPYDRQALRKRFAFDPLQYPRRFVASIDRTSVLSIVPDHFYGDRFNMPLSVERLVQMDTDGPLTPALEAAKGHMLAVGLNGERLDEAAAILGLEPRTLSALKGARAVALTADLEDALVVSLTVTFPDKAAAEAARPALAALLTSWANDLEAEQKLAAPAGEPEAALFGWAAGALRQFRVDVAESTLTATARIPLDASFRAALAAVPRVLDLDIDQQGASNNLKQIGYGFHNLHDTQGRFPGDIVGFGPQAQKWSWRVQILPFIEQDELFKKLNLNKPWDDPENLKILQAAEMPKQYSHPGRPADKGMTFFRTLTFPKGSKGTEHPLFDEGQPPPSLSSITDGSANTLMVVEARDAVKWYEPDILPYDGLVPVPQLGAATARKYLVLKADGSVASFHRKMPEKTLRAYITRSGGEVVGNSARW